MTGVVERYLLLGLRIGRHIPGFVDAYYGPAHLASAVNASPIAPPQRLVEEARALLAAIDAGEPLSDPTGSEGRGGSLFDSAHRRAWIRDQSLGLLTSARVLAGEHVGYVEEVASCYGIRPRRIDEDDVIRAHRDLDEVVPGTGALRERLIAWRESQAVPPDKLAKAVHSLAEDLRARTAMLFGLPEGERVEFEFVTNEPWSGFNYYLGGLKSRVAINIDLPVLSTSLGHLVAHEAYPGHHTEHSRKEAGLVLRERCFEETIFLVGTPQCALAEGLADLGLEVVLGRRPEAVIASHLHPLGIVYDPDAAGVIAEAGELLGAVRGHAALRLHEDGADPEVVVGELERMALLPHDRAEKSVEFLLDPTWRAYVFCYVEGLALCRGFVSGEPSRFMKLITEQCRVSDLTLDAAPARVDTASSNDTAGPR